MFGTGFRVAGVRRVADFTSGTAGGLTVFSLFIILMMLMAGGLAVDFMRQETTRVRLQSTLDRAILAAADMDHELDPEAVVRDYFAKANLSDYTLAVGVSDGLTARRVSAEVHGKLDPYFLNLIGITEIDAPAAGIAEETVAEIEISLVLDISGSMTENDKIGKLKVAAKEFVDTMFAQTRPGLTTISIVPYSTQVNAGARLLSEFNVSDEHAYSNCVDFAAGDYDEVGLSAIDPLQRTGHFDPTASDSSRAAQTFVCRTTGGTEVLPVSGDAAALKAKIDSLVATGWTSIDLGVKWGTALLDPSMRFAIDSMVASNDLSSAATGRPFAHESRAQKVIVVMTDGINTSQWYLDSRYKDGLSDVWMDPATGALSVRAEEPLNRDGDLVLGEDYYIPATRQFAMSPSGGANAVQLTYPELWANVSVKYNARQMTRASGLATDFLKWTEGTVDALTGIVSPGVFSHVGGAEKDRRLDRICVAAKQAGIVIYSIGFEVTDASAAVMEKCATDTDYFYRVSDTEIVEAFRAIANDIGKLRLTQ